MLRGHRLLFLKIDFVLANRADPDEMPCYGAFHLDLHCLMIHPFWGFSSTKGYGFTLCMLGKFFEKSFENTIRISNSLDSDTRGCKTFSYTTHI